MLYQMCEYNGLLHIIATYYNIIVVNMHINFFVLFDRTFIDRENIEKVVQEKIQAAIHDSDVHNCTF